MTVEERERLFLEYSKKPDNYLKEQANFLVASEKNFKKKSTTISICNYKKDLTEKQRNFLIFYIVDQWGKI
jgi:hypothetical protein